MNASGATPLQFAILRHEGIDPPHIDLLFELAPGGQLAAWRSNVWPIVEPVNATRLRDHRRLYLQYEGEIGGDRGRVWRVDQGLYLPELQAEACWIVHFLNVQDKPAGQLETQVLWTLRLDLATYDTWQARRVDKAAGSL